MISSIIAFALFLTDIIVYRQGRLYLDRYLCLMWIYGGTAVLSLIVNRTHISGAEPIYCVVKMIIPMVFTLMYVQYMHARDIRTICIILTVFAVLNMCISFVEMNANRAALAVSHISGVFSDRNLFCRFLTIVHCWLLIEFLASPRKRLLSASAALMAAIFVCVTFLMSRAGYLLYLQVNAMVLLQLGNKTVKRLMPFAFSAIAVLFVVMFYMRFKSEAMDVNPASDIGRVGTLKAGFNMIKASPVFGVGYSMANTRFSEFQDKHFRGLRNLQTIHNIYINVFAEQGIVGLAAFLLFNLSILFALRAACIGVPFVRKKVLLFCYISLSVLLVHGIFYHTMDYEGIYWIIIACAIIALRDKRMSEEAQSTVLAA